MLLAGDDAPDDPDTAGLVVAGVAGACAGDFVAGDSVTGDFVAGDSVAGVVVVVGSLDAEADAGWAQGGRRPAGEVVGGVGPVHSLFLTR